MNIQAAPSFGRARRAREGSQAVEFALVLPILVLILTGIMDVGWFFFQEQNLVNAVRVACRAGAVTLVADDPEGTATTELGTELANYGMDADLATVTVGISGAEPNQVLDLDVSMPYAPLVGMVPMPDNLTASLTMRIEDQSTLLADTGG